MAMVATSCVQTEELAVANNKEAIGFDTFVENVTKTIYDNNNPLGHFNVYGTISTKNADDTKTYVTTIFDGVEVTKSGDTWSYDPNCTQYWIPGFIYDFAAVVDATNVVCENGLPAKISTNMTAQNDVLYATKNCDFVNGGQTDKVSFQLAHLLSKAKFTVHNAITAGTGFVYNIESVKITNAYETAEYNVADKKWTGAGNREADFNVNTAIAQGANTVSKDILLVPGTKELAIEIVYSLKYNGATLISSDTKELTAVLTLAKGNAYNFVVEFGNPGEDIKFDAVVDTWVEGNYDVNGTSVVATVEEFTKAFASEGIDNIVLASDIVLDASTRSTVYSLIVASGRTLTLDLNGHTLSGNWHKDNGAIIKNEGTLTVVNGTISSLANNGGSAIANYGTLTVEDATLNGAPREGESWPSYPVNNYGDMTLTNTTIVGYQGCVALNAAGTTVINNCELTKNYLKTSSHVFYVNHADAKVVVNGGTYNHNGFDGSLAYVNKGEITINGGTFNAKDGGYGFAALSAGKVIINGGNINPALQGWGGQFVVNGGIFSSQPKEDYLAEGYKAVLSNGKYVVVANDVEAVASTQAELESALTTGGDVVLTAGEYTFPANKIQAGTTINCAEGTIFTGTSSLNINGATVIGATFKNEGGVAVSGTIYGTLKNCTFEGEEALRWCYTEAGKTVVFENCVINNNFRGFHFDDMKGDVLFKNCHINGFNAYGGEGTATFEGCTFGTDARSRYNGLNIYANTVLTDCTFIYKSGKTNFIDMEAAGNKSMTITNCTATLDGVAVDVADYVGGSKLPECTVTIDGETIVSDAASLKKAIINGGNIAFAKDITVDEWIMFSEDLNISNGTIITIDNINVSIDGKGHTLTVNAIESAGNNDQLFQGASVLNISNLTIQYADGLTAGGLGMDSGVIKNVHFIGGGSASSSAAIFPHNGVIKVEDCIFDTNGVALYFDDECDNLSVTRCTFNQKDNKNVILLRGDVKFTDNTINSGRTVNVVSGSPVVTGNNFNNVRFKVYGAATATISNNIINNLEFDGTTYASTFSGNTLSDAAQAALNDATKVN